MITQPAPAAPPPGATPHVFARLNPDNNSPLFVLTPRQLADQVVVCLFNRADELGLTMSDLKIAQFLARHKNAAHNVVHPGLLSIQRETGCSRTTVKRFQKKMKDARLAPRVPWQGRGGRPVTGYDLTAFWGLVGPFLDEMLPLLARAIAHDEAQKSGPAAEGNAPKPRKKQAASAGSDAAGGSGEGAIFGDTKPEAGVVLEKQNTQPAVEPPQTADPVVLALEKVGMTPHLAAAAVRIFKPGRCITILGVALVKKRIAHRGRWIWCRLRDGLDTAGVDLAAAQKAAARFIAAVRAGALAGGGAAGVAAAVQIAEAAARERRHQVDEWIATLTPEQYLDALRRTRERLRGVGSPVAGWVRFEPHEELTPGKRREVHKEMFATHLHRQLDRPPADNPSEGALG